jgi:type I restriction enzyme S subunit
MNYVVLSDVANIIMGQSPPSSTYNTRGQGLPFFQGKADFGDMYPTPRIYCSEPNRIAEPGDILITVRAPVGPTNLSRERACIGRGLSALRVGNRLDRNYLFYFLRFYEPELAKAGTGSTFAAISREDLETIKLPFPALSEQQRIAAILQKADRLRRLRRFARQLSDTYLQSVFLEMFGDPHKNPFNYPLVSLGKIGSLERGISKNRPRNAPELYGGKFPFIQTGDIANSIRYIRTFKQTYSEFDYRTLFGSRVKETGIGNCSLRI